MDASGSWTRQDGKMEMKASNRKKIMRRVPAVLAGVLLFGFGIGCSEEPAPTMPEAAPVEEMNEMGRGAPPPTAAPARPPAAVPQAAVPSRQSPEEWADMEEQIRVIEEIPFGDDDAPTAVEKLKPYLADPDLDVREATVMALASVDGDEASTALADHLRVERDSMIKVDMVDELVDRESPQTLDALLYLLGDPDSEVRERAADGLDELGDPRAIPGLHDALRGEPDEYVRDAILFALATLDPDFDEDSWEDEN
jgi:hypothetical protein